MTTQIHYFNTRSIARSNVEVLNGKFKDFGKDSVTGERWAVIVEVEDIPATVEMSQSMDTAIKNTMDFLKRESLLSDASIIAKQRPGIISNQVLKTPNNKPVHVSVRRNMTAVLSDYQLDNAS